MTAAEPTPLSGSKLLWATLALAVANLIVMLDMTIANVSIPHIAGSLGISPTQGTWTITSYAVADAITVPLTGWLTQRFGAVRTYIWCITGFGIFSVLCGLSTTLGMLVAARVGQGLCGGPLMPLTQVLMLRINPPEKRARSMGIWAMTTLIGPALGPILGGVISDNWSWHWIFFINVPVILFSLFGVLALIRAFETPIVRVPIDRIGLALMILWIGALQIMLDIGREHDWFADPTVVVLGIVALVGFLVFLIWELTEEHPIVDVRIFRHRGFSIAAVVMALGMGCYFAGIVVIPQWLQISMGYTATLAGITTAFTACVAMLVAQFPPRLVARGIDPRIMLSGGMAWLGMATLLRTGWTSGADFWTLSFPQMVLGLGMPFFFVTVTTMSLSAVEPREVASAAGLQSFLRTLAMAISTSVTMTYWDTQTRVAGSELAGVIHTDATADTLAATGFSAEQSRGVIAQMVQQEALMLSMDRIFLIAGAILLVLAICVWAAPRPSGKPISGGGH